MFVMFIKERQRNSSVLARAADHFKNDFCGAFTRVQTGVQKTRNRAQLSSCEISQIAIGLKSPAAAFSTKSFCQRLYLLSKVEAGYIHSFPQVKSVRRMALHAGVEMKFLAAMLLCLIYEPGEHLFSVIF